MKNIFIFFCFFFSQPLLHSNDSIPEFHVISIAKSGTHLLLKTIHILTNKKPIYAEIPSKLENKQAYYFAHFPLSNYAKEFFFRRKALLLVRDPRDILISMIYHIKKKGWPLLENDFFKRFAALSFDEQLLYLIQNDLSHHPFSRALCQAINTAFHPNSLLIKFENLVGERGGGTLNSQIEELKKIAYFLKIPFSEHLLKLIADDLYGIKSVEASFLANTFREGKIGSWKTSFNDAHKKEFKNRFGRYLILLGYEKNNDW